MSPVRKPQVRVRYSKLGKLRFTSHRDMARIWERSVRRLQLPIAYSEGFSPRAKLSFGLALPTVFESEAEFVDLTFTEPVGVDALPEQLTEVLPQGITVTGGVVLEGKVASLQESVEATSWSLFVDGDLDELRTWSGDLLAADELLVTRERKGKSSTDDVRPAVLAVEVRPNADTEALARAVAVAAVVHLLFVLVVDLAALALGRRLALALERGLDRLDGPKWLVVGGELGRF